MNSPEHKILRSQPAGPLLMVAAALAFTIMVAFVKVARQELSTFEVMVWRSLTAVPLAAAVASKRGFHIENRRILALRCTLGFGAMTCFYTAAKGLSVGDLSLITKLQPVLVAVIAPLFLGRGERAGATHWGLLTIALLGCVLLVAPDLQMGSVYGLWALAASVFSAGAHTAVRRLGATESPQALVFWFQAAVALFAIAAFHLSTGQPLALPPPRLWPFLLGCGLFATLGQYLMTAAYKADTAPRVAAASYSGPLFGYGGDLLFFRTSPSWLALAGGSLVVVAGMKLIFGGPASDPQEEEDSP